MKEFVKEVEANFIAFSAKWPGEMAATKAALDGDPSKYEASYKRLVSLQAWRVSLLEQIVSKDCLPFFLEAQNDALVSHVLARLGSWRAALQCLRSAVENALSCLFYMDHPVEAELWQTGKHRAGFTSLADYFTGHPRLAGIDPRASGMQIIRAEYATLSRAVHGSAVTFRMTVGQESTLMWSSEVGRLGPWATRETRTMLGLNLLLMTLFRNHIGGTSLPGLRQAVSFAVPASLRALVKSELHVALFKV